MAEPISLERNHGLDALKVAAAATVIMLHITAHSINQGHPTRAVFVLNGLTHWAVSAFVASSGFTYGIWLRQPRSGSEWLARRTKRLLWPYLFWSAVYIALLSLVALSLGNALPQWSPWEVVLTGGACSPMWFLPALYHASAIGLLALSPLGLIRLSCLVAGLAMTVGIAVETGMLETSFLTRLALLVFVHLVGALWGRYVGGRRFVLAGAAWSGGLVAVCILAAWSASLNTRGVSECTALSWGYAGVGMLFVFLSSRAESPSRLPFRMAAPWLIGIYASHSIWLEMYSRLVPDQSLPAVPWVVSAYAVVAVLTLEGVRCAARFTFLRSVLT